MIADQSLIVTSHVEAVTIAIQPSAWELRREALETAESVTQVQGETDQLLAVGALTEMRKLLKLVESSRQMVKAPVLVLGQKIDETAKGFSEGILAEVGRIERLISQFQVEQRQCAAEAEARRQAELRRIEVERLAAEREAQRKAQEEAARLRAEQERIAREAQAKAALEAAQARNERERQAAAQRAAEAQKQAETAALQARIEAETRQAAEAVERERQAQQAALAASAAPAVAPVRAEGLRVAEVWRFEVVNAKQVYLAHPELCVVTVQKSLVNIRLKNGLRECPGLKIWREVKAGVCVQ